VPRIHFSGRFFTDPSTVNNDPAHYEPGNRKPSPWQGPMGQHRFEFRDVLATSAQLANELSFTDPVVGASLATTNQPSSAKIADLDVYQQGVSCIYGLNLALTLANKASLIGNVDPPVLNSANFSRVLPKRGWTTDYGGGSYGGDSSVSGFFQNVWRIPAGAWPAGASPALDALRAASMVEDGAVLLSLRMVLDGYFNDPAQPETALTGRVTLAIGPAKAGEARQAPGPRWLAPNAQRSNPPKNWWVPAFSGAPFRVDESRKKLVIDLANSLCMQEVGGEPVDLGVLIATVRRTGQPVVNVGDVPYQTTYGESSAIAELALDAASLEALKQAPLQLATSRTDLDAPPEVLVEDPNGRWLAVEQRALRMTSEPGSAFQIATSRVRVTEWGRPLAGVQLALAVEAVSSKTPGVTPPPDPDRCKGDTPSANGALGADITPTDASGFATLKLKSLKDPGSRTAELDGQLYFVLPYIPGAPDPSKSPMQEQMVSVLMWSAYTPSPSVTWDEIVGILAPYDKLYPFMAGKIRLTDPHTFTTFARNPPWKIVYGDPSQYTLPNGKTIAAGAIPYMLTRPVNDPRFMPISRDLSPGKINAVLYYCLQLQASTIPPPPPPAQGGAQ
jgi:hypothetical protein